VIDMQVRSESGAVVIHGSNGIRWPEVLVQLDPEIPQARVACCHMRMHLQFEAIREDAAELLRLIFSTTIGEEAAVVDEGSIGSFDNGSHLHFFRGRPSR
jgi:hypothetical protein